jgi:S1-C subfamily serine protease
MLRVRLRRFETQRELGALLALSIWLFAAPAAALPLQEIVERAKPAVVLLSARHPGGGNTPRGSGFLISKDGRVATNFHVVDSALRLEAGTVSTGIVSAVRERDDDAVPGRLPEWTLQITAPISPGSSGSPILDQDAEVVGVAVGSATHGQALNFGVAVAALRAANGRAPSRYGALGSERSFAENIAISALVLLGLGAVAWLVSRFGKGEPGVDSPDSAGTSVKRLLKKK